MKILVAIASYGKKNLPYLRRTIDTYRSMSSYEIDIVVHSNECLEFGDDVNVAVGIPYANRMAMPFAHKELFFKNSEHYDLFIYGEDDILITENNINAFCEVTSILPQTEIPGFFRFERNQIGERYYPDVFRSFHFDPTSIRTRKGLVFAEFTNEHAGCYILTQSQLKRAIGAGRYHLKPRSGPYTIACTASTDPYKTPQVRKVLCVSRFDDFLVHHQPNKFIGKVGIHHEELAEQLNAIKDLAAAKTTGKYLFEISTSLQKTNWWNKNYFEVCNPQVFRAISRGAETVLSVGCGYAIWENQLAKTGIKVVGIPLDTIISRVAQKRGIEVTDPDFKSARQQLEGRKFDCIVFINVLHHLKYPVDALRAFSSLLEEDGRVVASMPNFHHAALLGLRFGISRKGSPRFMHSRKKDARQLGNFKQSGLHLATPFALRKWFAASDLTIRNVEYVCDGNYQRVNTSTCGLLKRLLGHEVIVIATRKHLLPPAASSRKLLSKPCMMNLIAF